MARFFTPLLLAFALLAAPALADDVAKCGTPAALDDGWSLAKPEESGFDATRLCELDDFLAQWPAHNIHAVVVVRHGKLVMERYFKGADERLGRPIGSVQYGPESRHDLRSITKSVTSLLIGIALAEGKFPALDSPVFDQFPEFAALRTAGKSEITFRHLLTMSSGLAWDESLPYSNPANSETRMDEAADPVRYVLEQPLATLPGAAYNYNGGGTTLLGALLAKTTGQRLDAYAREKLFGPLGITDFEWADLPATGQPAAASGLRLRPRDTAKFGQLLLAGGQWNGKQVLPKGWAADSTKPRLNGEGLYFYGYQWWLGRTMLRGRALLWTAGVGYGGQRLFIQPDLDLVVMVNAGHYTSPLQGVIPLAIFNRWVLPTTYD